MKTGYYLPDGSWSGILRKDIPLSKHNRSQCCVWGIIDSTGQNRDLVCGRSTTKFWDKDAECWSWESWCKIHKERAIAQDLGEL